MPPPLQRPWELYQRELFPRGYGFPVWNASPEPGHPELDVGAVGFYDDWAHFVTLFNAMKSENDPVNDNYGVPEGYEPLTKSNASIRGEDEAIGAPLVLGTTLKLRSGANTALESPNDVLTPLLAGSPATTFRVPTVLPVQSGATSGAFLVVDTDNTRARRIPNHKCIVNYMRQHHDSWLHMAKSRMGLDVELEQLTFISGTTKTTRYIAAAFELPDSETPEEVSVRYDLHASPHPIVSVSADCGLKSFSYRSGSTAQARTPGLVDRLFAFQQIRHEGTMPSFFVGPNFSTRLTLATAGRYNLPGGGSLSERAVSHCVFVHYYRMKSRVFWMAEIRAAAGPQNLPDDDDDDDWRGPTRFTARDSVDVLLNYILNYSNAELAIASTKDTDILPLNDGILSDLEAAVVALKPIIKVDEHGVGTIAVDDEDMDHWQVNASGSPHYSALETLEATDIGTSPSANRTADVRGPKPESTVKALDTSWIPGPAYTSIGPQYDPVR